MKRLIQYNLLKMEIVRKCFKFLINIILKKIILYKIFSTVVLSFVIGYRHGQANHIKNSGLYVN